jgi:predicted nucleic acid-binding protein
MVEKETGEDSIELEYDMAGKFDCNDMYFGALPLVMNLINIKKFLSDPKEDSSKDSE